MVNNDNLNEDWIKTLHWDGPATAKRLGYVLGLTDASTDAQRAEVFKRFLKLPAAVAIPDNLRQEIEHVIAQGTVTASAAGGRQRAARRIVTPLRLLKREK